jgi:murein L,D-transpeptidase YcbB/YkuD
MRTLRYDRVLAGTALVLILAASPGISQTAPNAPAAFEAAVPMPEAPLPPPTIADINPAPATEAPAITGTVAAPAPAAVPAQNAAPQIANVAPAETVAPDPLAALDPADRPIAEKMRDLLAAKVDKIFANKKERAAAEAFYQNRTLAPLWLEKGVVSARASAAIARLKSSNADGLDPNDYRIPALSAASPEALAEAELKLTATMLTFARHLQAGRFPQARIGQNIEMPQQPPDPADVLAKLADADIAKALDGFAPPHPGYRKLKAMLADMRGKAGGGTHQMAEGEPLRLTKVLTEDPRVPMLRERLGVAGDPSDLRYDAKLADAVKKYQRANDINVTGTLDARTVKELNGPPRSQHIDVIIANMERWRWVPRDLGNVHVIVNIPEYTLRVMKDGGVHWSTRIVVGKPHLQTPLLTASMKYITVNPTWNVPPSIINNEYLPALAQDPTVLTRMGLKMEHNRDGTVHIYQPPGDGNALGRVRFNFPNRFLVYQHDTPDKNLFSHEARAYSHGCMRVQDPPKYAEVLLNLVRPTEGWTAERIKKMYGNSEVDIQFPTHIPVHLTYQTASVDDGKLVVRKDIYGYDAKMIAAIKSERGMVEMAQERPRDNSGGGGVKRARLQQPPTQSASFFDSWFGGNRTPPQNVPNPQQQQRRFR